MNNNKNKLSIKIENKKPIELNQFTSSLNALAKEYDHYCKEKLGHKKNDRKLEVLKLSQGSILIELVSLSVLAASVIPPHQDSIVTFGKFLIDALSNFIHPIPDELEEQYTKKDCDNLSTLLEQTANDRGSNLTIVVNGGNNNSFNISLNDVESAAAQNNIAKYQQRFSEEAPLKQYKVPFYWASASFSKAQNVGTDKGFIDAFDAKAHKVIFENEED